MSSRSTTIGSKAVEETLNALLDAEADRLAMRSEARRDMRAGHYERNLQTKAGEVRRPSTF
jgi:putative transposase